MAKPPSSFLKLVAPGDAPADRPDASLQERFPGPSLAAWLRASRRIADAGYGDAVSTAYNRFGPHCAAHAGADAAIALADLVSLVAIKCGRRPAAALPAAAAVAAERLDDKARFRAWSSLMQRFIGLAPESVELVIDRMDALLAALPVSGLEAWMLTGVRGASGDSEKRRKYFALETADSTHWVSRAAGDVAFADVERAMRPFLTALYGVSPPIAEPPPSAPEPSRRRAGFSSGVIRMPATFPGYRGERARDLFRAALAHIGAHLTFGGPPQEIGELKPLQMALVGVLEDARVERLALRRHPGLFRLWSPFHIAEAGGADTVPALLARLSRALIDPDFRDGSAWVEKARTVFESAADRFEDVTLTRQMGNLLGHDLGQMRLQFNAKTYIVEPPYRDDGWGLWTPPPSDAPPQEMDLVVESVRREPEERPDGAVEDTETEDERDTAPSMSAQAAEETGGPIAKLPEYDYQIGRERDDWTTIVDWRPPPGDAARLRRRLERYEGLSAQITRVIRAAKVGRAERLKRQPDGEALDLDACIADIAALRSGDTPDGRVYQRIERRRRDLAVHLLIDASQSTADRADGGLASILDLERDAATLLAQAMTELGDPFAIGAFCSNGRDEVQFATVKGFDDPFDRDAEAALMGLSSNLSTRLGAALRYAGGALATRRNYRRLLLVLSDGEPSDVDADDERYLTEDARRAVHTLGARGIDVFCVALGGGHDAALTRVFGRRNLVRIDRIEALPERLPLLYLRLTA